jgi:hypothetical protein
MTHTVRWRPTSRLTVSLGLRGDYIASRDLLFDIAPRRTSAGAKKRRAQGE